MKNKIGLSLVDNNRIRLLLDSSQPILIELRSGECGGHPYQFLDVVTEIQITERSEMEKCVAFATQFATTDFGVQSLFDRKLTTGELFPYESCFIEFSDCFIECSDDYATKADVIAALRELTAFNDDWADKINAVDCTELIVSFPIDNKLLPSASEPKTLKDDWVLMTDEMPPLGVEVYIYIPSNIESFSGQHTAWRVDDEHFVCNMNVTCPIPIKLVTHWHKLLKNPK